MTCKSVFNKYCNNSNEDACVKEYDEEDRTKECSKEDTNVTDKAAERREKEELQSIKDRIMRKTQLLTIQALQSCCSVV